ncbi:MAG: GntR family transcriptional regulator [Qingshengfaniella sp.]
MVVSSGAQAEQELYREIRRAIMERRLLPGTKLTEESLGDLFSVSRARVRKVLSRLEKEKLVQLIPNRGAFVWKPTVAEARNVLEVRKLVETHLVREAAKRATSTQIARLRTTLEQELRAKQKQRRTELMRLSGEFHMRLAQCAQNPILEEFLGSLLARSYLILSAYQRYAPRNCPQDDHGQIVDCVATGDADGAVALLETHFQHMADELDLSDDERPDNVDLGKILQRRS